MTVRAALLVPVCLALVPPISAQYTGKPPPLVRPLAIVRLNQQGCMIDPANVQQVVAGSTAVIDAL